MISVPLPRVFPLGSFDTEKEESAVDSLQCQEKDLEKLHLDKEKDRQIAATDRPPMIISARRFILLLTGRHLHSNRHVAIAAFLKITQPIINIEIAN